MPQPSVRFVRALLTIGFLAVSSVALARSPSIASTSPSAPSPQLPAGQSDATTPPKPGQPASSDAERLKQPNQPPTPLRIPSALAPYLDPGFHPDLQFEPKPTPAEVDPQALRLEIRLSRRQVTLYRGDALVKSYPIAVGRPGWETPVGTYEVKQMIKNPTWVHPLQKGVVIPGGDPENPLGRYWIGFWTDGKNWIGFHGTPTPRSVGRAASHGCVRMYNKDVEALFKQVTLGTVVTVVK
ncbi:MAG: L,D-transpeptidase family protein [Lyngbya sp. HA4199-MV5]|jgi:lipoprotein-anchoring transpeptidase ErfK/SrfK|nr:L,D-transpeptidase family protein [Lyngbya sp. HA4199-MV5]